MALTLKSDAAYALLVPSSMGIRLTPADRLQQVLPCGQHDLFLLLRIGETADNDHTGCFAAPQCGAVKRFWCFVIK